MFIIHQLNKLFIDMGLVLKRIRTDFDHKIIGEDVKKHLSGKGRNIQADLSGGQHQNGLVEQSWQPIVPMARDWFTQNLTPTSSWWYLLKRVV